VAYTIDQEAKRFSRSPLSIEKMADRYKTDNNLFSFPSPTLETIEKYLFFLLRNSTVKVMDSKYRLRPDYLSYDEYDTVILWELLMYVNGVFAVEDFTLNEVVVPSLSSIIEMNQANFPEKNIKDLYSVNW
jgi:hypothetical protein